VVIKLIKADWYFVIPATVVWVLSLILTAWDFLVLQGAVYRFSAVSAFGLLLFVMGVLLRAASKRTLSKNYSYVLKNGEHKELVERGIYHYVRHPIYLASILYIVGVPVIFSSLYGFVAALFFLPCVLYRIRIEEKLLIREFGKEYLEYKKCTKKLIPFVY
jgi:protein-S-isoprenylcysteine O-methyltransferase Ste14